MPVSTNPGQQKWKLRQVPPGFLNGEKYHLILGNLPFKKDWGDLKNWLDQQLQIKAPPGHEARYKVDHSQTFKGDGWVRVRGLDVFNAAVEILNKIPWEHRYLIVNDENRSKAVMIRDIPDASPRSQDEAASQNFHVLQSPDWEAQGKAYGDNAAQPGPSCTYNYTYAEPEPVPAYVPVPQAYPASYALSFAPPGTYLDAGSSGYVPTSLPMENICPETYSSYCYAQPAQPAAYPAATTEIQPEDAFYTEQRQVMIQPEDVFYTEQRQVMIRNIPIKHFGKKKERPLSKDDVKGWIKTRIERAGYDLQQEVDRIVVEHKSSDPSILRGYAVLHMTKGTSAQNMVALFNGAVYENRVLTAELGKDATTIGRTSKASRGRKNVKSPLTESMASLSLSSSNTGSTMSTLPLAHGTYIPPQPAIAVGTIDKKETSKYDGKEKKLKN